MVIEIYDDQADDEDTIVLLPDDYKSDKSFHAVGIVKESGSCSPCYSEGDMVVYPRHLVQEFVFKGKTTYLVLENHILCTIQGE